MFLLILEVPISWVSMTKPASGNTANTILGRNSTFQCKTSEGLPAATVLWYKDEGDFGTVDEFIFTEAVSDTEGLVIVSSTLTLTPTIDDHNKQIYCTANNTETTLLTTRILKLNVQCK